MAEFNVTISKRNGTHLVCWGREGLSLGMVPVLTRDKAERLQAKLEEGVEPAQAVQETLSTKSRVEFARAGGAARAANQTAAQRKALAERAAAARWGKKGAKKG